MVFNLELNTHNILINKVSHGIQCVLVSNGRWVNKPVDSIVSLLKLISMGCPDWVLSVMAGSIYDIQN